MPWGLAFGEQGDGFRDFCQGQRSSHVGIHGLRDPSGDALPTSLLCLRGA